MYQLFVVGTGDTVGTIYVYLQSLPPTSGRRSRSLPSVISILLSSSGRNTRLGPMTLATMKGGGEPSSREPMMGQTDLLSVVHCLCTVDCPIFARDISLTPFVDIEQKKR